MTKPNGQLFPLVLQRLRKQLPEVFQLVREHVEATGEVIAWQVAAEDAREKGVELLTELLRSSDVVGDDWFKGLAAADPEDVAKAKENLPKAFAETLFGAASAFLAAISELHDNIDDEMIEGALLSALLGFKEGYESED